MNNKKVLLCCCIIIIHKTMKIFFKHSFWSHCLLVQHPVCRPYFNKRIEYRVRFLFVPQKSNSDHKLQKTEKSQQRCVKLMKKKEKSQGKMPAYNNSCDRKRQTPKNIIMVGNAFYIQMYQKLKKPRNNTTLQIILIRYSCQHTL